ncbi:hypothetical protein SAMN05878281_0915 [Salegentibacter salegens]|uniref:Uncharacterized protein n=1 Tax=Salegentibacter salegens TaxID=143223 RepID=A0A1M7JDI4_9FLAO|nr:hypothetical protein SAMN05878281_0915 [Salegentibacter salegens]
MLLTLSNLYIDTREQVLTDVKVYENNAQTMLI